MLTVKFTWRNLPAYLLQRPCPTYPARPRMALTYTGLWARNCLNQPGSGQGTVLTYRTRQRTVLTYWAYSEDCLKLSSKPEDCSNLSQAGQRTVLTHLSRRDKSPCLRLSATGERTGLILTSPPGKRSPSNNIPGWAMGCPSRRADQLPPPAPPSVHSRRGASGRASWGRSCGRTPYERQDTGKALPQGGWWGESQVGQLKKYVPPWSRDVGLFFLMKNCLYSGLKGL
jgi:hypothetical protein